MLEWCLLLSGGECAGMFQVGTYAYVYTCILVCMCVHLCVCVVGCILFLGNLCVSSVQRFLNHMSNMWIYVISCLFFWLAVCKMHAEPSSWLAGFLAWQKLFSQIFYPCDVWIYVMSHVPPSCMTNTLTLDITCKLSNQICSYLPC